MNSQSSLAFFKMASMLTNLVLWLSIGILGGIGAISTPVWTPVTTATTTTSTLSYSTLDLTPSTTEHQATFLPREMSAKVEPDDDTFEVELTGLDESLAELKNEILDAKFGFKMNLSFMDLLIFAGVCSILVMPMLAFQLLFMHCMNSRKFQAIQAEAAVLKNEISKVQLAVDTLTSSSVNLPQ